jgi:TrmH family RNA methyltransferase
LSGTINSPKNERIREYRRLRKKKFRYRSQKFIVEGLQAVTEALLHEHRLECLFCNQKGIAAMKAYADLVNELSIPCFEVSEEIINVLASTVTPQGIIAISPFFHVDVGRLAGMGKPTLLMANRVRDPGNLGNLVRIADAAGAGGIIICDQSVDIYNAKTVRSTAGSIFHLPIALAPDIKDAVRLLKAEGYAVLAAEAHLGVDMWEAKWPEKLALVMGNESWGNLDEDKSSWDGIVRVPILGKAESLNVAVAAALLLYEVERRRKQGQAEEERPYES